MLRINKDENILSLAKVILDKSPVIIDEVTIERYDSIDIAKKGINYPYYCMSIHVNSRVSYEVSQNTI